MSKIQQALLSYKSTHADRPRLERDSLNSQGAQELASPGKAVSTEIISVDEPYGIDEQELDRLRIVYPGMKDQIVERAFRDLRTTVVQKTGRSGGLIMVTGVSENSGTSFVAMNLAAALAFDRGKSSVLLDCNLRRKGHYDQLVSEGSLGITDLLRDPTLSRESIVNVSGIPRLRIVPTGSQHNSASESFTHEQAVRFFHFVKGKYRNNYSIIDAPPLVTAADARVLLDFCDYVLVVVNYAQSSSEQVEALRREIPKKKFLGVVVNRLPRSV